MTRQDLRHQGTFSNVETPMNEIAARNLEVLRKRAARRAANAKTLKRVVISLLIVAALAVLWSSQKSCERTNGSNSAACVD